MFPVERVPEKIGAYSVVKYVGRTGMADVYIARMEGPLDFARTVSLKIVRFALEDDARLADELAREAAICSRLNHPAVLRMFDFFEYERKLVLVLEQSEGATLEKLTSSLARRKQKLADSAILYIAVEVAQALAHAHASCDDDGNASPVIHRNVQPENVLVSWDGRVKLAGFGLGKILGKTPDSVAGTVTGTPGFMSPEQTRGERATARSDVYGLGALLWTLFADTPLPTDGQRPASISTLRPDIPREMGAAIDAALEPSADRRRITCHELAQWASQLVNVEKGREELHQKVVVLRSTRDAVEAPRIAAAMQRPRRRPALAQTRGSLRRNALVTSSYPAPPPSTRAREGADESDSDPPTSQAFRLPPPPPLPQDRYENERKTGSRGSQPAGRFGSQPASRSGSQPAGRFGSQPVGRFGSSPASQRGSQPAAGPGSERQPASSRGARASVAPTVRPVSFFPPAPPPPRSIRPIEPSPYGTPDAPSYERRGTLTLEVQPTPSTAGPLSLARDLGPASAHAQMVTLDREHATPTGLVAVPEAVGPDGRPYRVRGIESPRADRQAIVVPVLTALLVVAVGLLVLRWKTPSSTAAEKPPAALAAPLPPQPAATPATTSEATRPVATATASAAPLDLTVLLPDTGYLTVKNAENLDVYVNGIRVGPTNQPGISPCGQRFLHLAVPNSGPMPAWLGRGETIVVACRGETVLSAQVAPQFPDPVHYPYVGVGTMPEGALPHATAPGPLPKSNQPMPGSEP